MYEFLMNLTSYECINLLWISHPTYVWICYESHTLRIYKYYESYILCMYEFVMNLTPYICMNLLWISQSTYVWICYELTPYVYKYSVDKQICHFEGLNTCHDNRNVFKRNFIESKPRKLKEMLGYIRSFTSVLWPEKHLKKKNSLSWTPYFQRNWLFTGFFPEVGVYETK